MPLRQIGNSSQLGLGGGGEQRGRGIAVHQFEHPAGGDVLDDEGQLGKGQGQQMVELIDQAGASERWKREHPRFPGVAKCVELLKQPNIRGAMSEVICGELLARAPRILGDLVEAVEGESDERVKRLLLRVISESRLPEAVPVLGRNFYDSDGRVRGCCITALRAIGTEEARRALADHGWS